MAEPFEKLEAEALEQAKAILPPELLTKLKDKKVLQDVKKEIHQVVVEFDKITNTLKSSPDETLDEVFAHLSKERRDLIVTTFRNQTFVVNIDAAARVVTFTTKEGEEVFPSILLDSVEYILKVKVFTTVSIVLEAFIFLLNLIGFQVPNSPEYVKKVCEYLIPILSDIQEITDKIVMMVAGYREGDYNKIARGIFSIVLLLYNKGLFGKILNEMLASYSWWDWIKAIVGIVAMIVASVASGGLALVAELVLKVKSAVEFLQKLTSLGSLRELEEKMLK